MLQRITSLGVMLFFLIACEKEPDIEFPILVTLDPINIDETGATFRGELVQKAKNKTTNYGFIWSINEPLKNNTERIITGNDLSEGLFETRINFSLSAGFEYEIRSFATYNNKTVYGNAVTFLSKGCANSLWSKELSGVSLEGYGTPYAWTDGIYGYVIFQNAKAYKFNADQHHFSILADFPVSGNTGTKYSVIYSGNTHYVFSNIDRNLYQLENGAWSVKSNSPINYGNFGGYYHGYSASNDIILLSSLQSIRYNPETSFFQNLTAMPSEGFSICGTDLDGFAYVMDCGKNINRYDPHEDVWEYLSTFPGIFPEGSVYFDRFYGNLIGFSHGDRIYFGFSHDQSVTEIEESIWAFNLVTNTWEEIQKFPLNLSFDQIFYFYLKDKLYIGHKNSGAYSIYSLDVAKIL